MLHRVRFTVPKPLPAEISRSRLLERFDQNRDVRIIALIAPSGFGKTTVLAQYARAVGQGVIWLGLTEEDVDPDQLSRHFCEAVVNSGFDIAFPSEDRYVPASLVARLLNERPEHLILIFDGMDVVGGDSARWLEELFASLGEGHRVLMSSYVEPAVRLTRYVTQGTAVVVSGPELAFSQDEGVAYLNARGYASDAVSVHRTLDGWPAGMALVASGASPHYSPQNLVLEALDRLGPGLRSSLPEASALTVWSEPLAAQLGCRLPKGWLRELRRTGLPLAPLGENRYRPHQVLLEVLQQQLRADAERYRQLHEHAARAAEKRGDFMEALRHYLSAEAQDSALRLAGTLAQRYELNGQFRLVRAVLEHFKPEVLGADLEALLGQALLETGEIARGEALLQRLYNAGQRDARVCYSLGMLAARRGQHQSQLQNAEEGLAASSSQGLKNALTRLKAGALLGLDRANDALEITLEVVDCARRQADFYGLGAALNLLQLIYERLGRIAERQDALEEALAVYRSLDSPVRTLVPLNDLADLERLRGNSDKGFALIEEALEIARREDNVMQAVLYETRGDLHVWTQNFEAASQDYEAASKFCEAFSIEANLPRLRLKRSEVWHRLGQPAEAERSLRAARQHQALNTHGLPAHFDFYEGYAHFVRGDLEAAQRRFSALTEPTIEPSLLPRALAFRAEIARRQGQLDDALLETWNAALDAFGNDELLRLDEVLLADLYAESARRHPTRARFQSAPLRNATPSERGAPRLEVQLLGCVAVSIDGTKLHLPLARAGELLAYLCLHGPSTREALIDALWDGDASPKNVDYIKLIVRRLRDTLATHEHVNFNPLPFEDGRYGLSRHFHLEVDALQLGTALRSHDPATMQRALESYQGAFLPNVETEWTSAYRQRYLEDAAAIALWLGKNAETSSAAEAELFYERAMSIDPLGEAPYTHLIRFHHARGNVLELQRVYRDFATMLRDEFGGEPDQELRKLVQSI